MVKYSEEFKLIIVKKYLEDPLGYKKTDTPKENGLPNLRGCIFIFLTIILIHSAIIISSEI